MKLYGAQAHKRDNFFHFLQMKYNFFFTKIDL